MYAIKWRKQGEKRYCFLTSNGGGNYLRIHAAQYENKETAEKDLIELREGNPNLEFRIQLLYKRVNND